MSSGGREELLRQIGLVGARPFLQQVVHSPWNPVIDVEELHQPLKQRIAGLLAQCGERDAPRCLTARAAPGFGKTHLLAWVRQHLEERGNGLFVYVAPYRPEYGSLEQHVFRCTFESLRQRSQAQRERFDATVQRYLVQQYDALVQSRRRLRELGAGSFWRRLLRPSSLKIGDLPPQEQQGALRRAFRRVVFLHETFMAFGRERDRPGEAVDGVRPDWDTFVAACLLACSDDDARWYADSWFRNDPVPPGILGNAYLRQRCEGTVKVLNGLYTLQRLTGQALCLGFDQFEDTYRGLEQAGHTGGQLGQLLTGFLGQLNATPHVCMLFMVETAVWQDLVTRIPAFLVQRMTAGHGVQALGSLDDTAAQALVRRRMQQFVWNLLPGQGPPDDCPCFPFSDGEVRRLRLDAGSELREFLQHAQRRFDQHLAGRIVTHPLELLRIEPAEVKELTQTAVVVHGRHLPAEVEVLLDGQPLTQVVCRPDEGTIEFTTPVRRVGVAAIDVHAVGDPANSRRLMLRFLPAEELPRPYAQHIDHKLLLKRRKELKMTQAQVARAVGTNQTYISRLERGNWPSAPDDLCRKLAEVYHSPLSAFRKTDG